MLITEVVPQDVLSKNTFTIEGGGWLKVNIGEPSFASTVYTVFGVLLPKPDSCMGAFPGRQIGALTTCVAPINELALTTRENVSTETQSFAPVTVTTMSY